MSTCARLVCVLTLLATSAAAQSTTEDGIRAMLRGDYQAAARILRPLADDTARPDPVAQFFLAILYDTGHGGDNARACGLFLRAATPANPFREQSATIGALSRNELGGAASLMCVPDEKWQGGPPQSFVLAPGHRVVFADTSTTVTYGGQELRTIHLLPPGAAFLPIQYTPLAVTRPIVASCHFFQWFAWTPDTTVNPSSWTLSWSLSEVVGEEWIGSVEHTTVVLYNDSVVTSQEFKRWLQNKGCTFEPGRGGHLVVRLGDKVTDLPMHGKQKELGTGLVNSIKKHLGLK
jgi:mRNA interferase HicA